MISTGVFGAKGKMGHTVCQAVTSDPDLELVAQVDIGDDPSQMSGAQVAVDFTSPDAVIDNIAFCVNNGIHCVVGTSGLTTDDHSRIAAMVKNSNVAIVPNFSIGAVLMMDFARRAARHLGSCEVIELHHNQKLDAPSGTSWATALEIARVWLESGRPPGGEAAADETEKVKGARGADVEGVRVHSIRLQGLVAHQEVVFGGPGQTLTIRHDSLDRASFMPGVIAAVKAIGTKPGLTIGLENLIDF